MFARAEITPRIACETEEDEVIAGLVSAGFGIAVVPYMDMLLKLDVKIIKITSPAYERSFFMVNDDRLYMPPVLRASMILCWTGADFKMHSIKVRRNRTNI